jgi:hypothetical protein
MDVKCKAFIRSHLLALFNHLFSECIHELTDLLGSSVVEVPEQWILFVSSGHTVITPQANM